MNASQWRRRISVFVVVAGCLASAACTTVPGSRPVELDWDSIQLGIFPTTLAITANATRVDSSARYLFTDGSGPRLSASVPPQGEQWSPVPVFEDFSESHQAKPGAPGGE